MIKVLIVDDEKPICDLIDMNLTAAGYHCRAVQDGVSALKMIEGESFDLILLDVMLPGVDGYDIMEYIRPLEVPVIFITAKHEVRDRVKGLRLGADEYLVKPFDMVEQDGTPSEGGGCDRGCGGQDGNQGRKAGGTDQQGVWAPAPVYPE